MNITRGKKKVPQRIVIYGPEGIGKSTLASKFPNPLFIDAERGTDALDVARVTCNDYVKLTRTLSELNTDSCGFETLVLDTIDWVESELAKCLCRENHKNSIEDWGYGKGYTVLDEKMKEMLTWLDSLRDNKGMTIVLLAHAQVRKWELPDESGAFDKWELKLSKKVAQTIKEYADALLFCNYKTRVVSDGSRSRAVGSERVIYTTHGACWDAKNRWGLDDMVPMDYASLAPYVEGTSPKAGLVADIRVKLADAGITEEAFKALAENRGKVAAGTPLEDYSIEVLEKWALGNWSSVIKVINGGN